MVAAVGGTDTVQLGQADLDRLLATALDRPAEGLAEARRLLAGSPSPLVAAVAHQTAGIVLRDFGAIGEALRELRAAHRSARAAGDPGREADILSTLGSALVMAGRTRPGLAALARAVEGSPRGPDARVLVRRAHVHWLLGANADALADARIAVELLRDGRDPVWQARAYSHRAMASHALGRLPEADRDFARCESLFLATGQQLEYAAAREDRGATAFARGDLPAALTFLDDAQRVIEELDVFEPELFVTRCQVLLSAGLAREALALAEAGLARSRQLGGAAVRHAELLLVATAAARAAGELGTALDHGAAALAMLRRQGRARLADQAEVLLLQSRFDAGEGTGALLRRTAGLARTLAGSDPAHAAEADLLAGRIALDIGRPRTASRHLQRAAAARSPELRARTVAWLARATLAEAEGRRTAMLAACSRGLRVLDARLSTLGGTELRAGATAQGAALTGIALRDAVAAGDAAQLFRWSERWRATVLANPPARPGSAGGGGARGAGEADGAADAVEMGALRATVRRLGAPDLRVEARRALESERRRLERIIRARALRQAGAFGPRAADASPAQVRATLDDAVLVQLTDVDGVLQAVLVPPAGPLRQVPVGPVSDAESILAHALFALRRQAARPERRPLDLPGIGAGLQQALLGPVVDHLQDRALVVVPPGRLHAIPWALMPALHDRPVVVAPSVSTWLRARRATPPAERRVVLVGGPELTGGRAEIAELARRYPDAQVLDGENATAGKVLAAMDGAWLVHVAAHGTFRADSPLFSALELHDGPLTAYDLERLDRAPHRVVLSSCDSAIGSPSGADELLGVVSALIAQGAVGVLGSVVPIDDPGTVPFMLALHERLATRSLGEALTGARHAVAGDRRATAAATSFVALGS